VTSSTHQERAVASSFVGAIRYSEPVTTLKRVTKSGGSLVVVLPKELVNLLQLEHGSTVELRLRKVASSKLQPSTFERL
jgi:hypothetical protein